MKMKKSIWPISIVIIVIGYFLINLEKLRENDSKNTYSKELIGDVSWSYLEEKDHQGTYRIACVYGRKVSGLSYAGDTSKPYIIVSRLNYDQPTIGFFDFGFINLTDVHDERYTSVDLSPQVTDGYEYMAKIWFVETPSVLDTTIRDNSQNPFEGLEIDSEDEESPNPFLYEGYWYHSSSGIQTNKFPIILSYFDYFGSISKEENKLWIVIQGKYESIYEFTLQGAKDPLVNVLK